MTESHRSGSHVPWDRPLSQWLACKPLEMLDLQPNFVVFGLFSPFSSFATPPEVLEGPNDIVNTSN